MLDCSSGTRFPLKVMVLELKFGLMVTVALFPPSDVRYGSVYCYTANAVRTWVYGVEGYLHGATSLVDQYEVGVGVYKCGLSVAEHHLVCLHYELVSFQGRHCVIVRNGILCLFFSFQACTFCVSLGFTVCALFSSTLLCIHGRCCHAYQYYCC